jgi:hypothetical protein
MGLDMYLSAKKYLHEFKEEDKAVIQEVTKIKAINTRGFPVKEITVDAMYWRKANQIHNWFVNNCQQGVDDCKQYYISRESLKRLRELCVKTLLGEVEETEGLPTQEGFFFGSTEYDAFYFKDLQDTVKGLNKVLELDDSWDFYYQSSW